MLFKIKKSKHGSISRHIVGLTDARMRASDKDLPVHMLHQSMKKGDHFNVMNVNTSVLILVSLKYMSKRFMRGSNRSSVTYVTIAQKSVLTRHVASVHENKKPYSCQIYDQRFSEKSAIKTHVAVVDDNKQPFQCEICEKKFALRA